MADQSEPVVKHAHVEALATFLAKFRYDAITDSEIKRGISKTCRLLDKNDPFVDKLGSTRSRFRIARQNLGSIKKEFGDAVYYLCLVALGPTPLSTFVTGGTGKALANWPDRNKIPQELTEKVKRAVEAHLTETQDGHGSSSGVFSPKRHRSMLDKEDRGTTEDHGKAPKRSRTGHASELNVMSIAEITEGTKQIEGSQQSLVSLESSAPTTRENIGSGTSSQSLFVNQHSRGGTGDYQLPHTEPRAIALSGVETQGIITHDAIMDNDGEGNDSDDSNDRDDDEGNYPAGYASVSQPEHLPMLRDSRLPMPPMQQYGVQQYGMPPTATRLIEVNTA